jgi:3-hydroxyacyl-CoA dehydrogenase
MNDLVQFNKDRDVAIITINNPPVNALSPGVLEGILTAMEAVECDPEIKTAVLTGAGSTFIAGADIKEFGKITAGQKPRGEGLHPLLNRIEDCRKPIVMAIHGNAFGGGLELAMAGHYRIAAPDARLGQPEVKLGLIPGAGGTQRLPRLVGVARAVEMCALGDPIGAQKALECGLIDRLLEGDLLPGAVAFARDVAAQAFVRTRDRDDKLGTAEENEAIFDAAHQTSNKKQRGLFASHAVIDAVKAATTLPFDEGCELERKLFMDCLFSDQSKALIHVFFGEREVGKVPDVPKDTITVPVTKAAVVGAGTMGSGIAMVLANAGIPVLLKETDPPALNRGWDTIQKNYAASVQRGRFSQDFVDHRLRLITPTLTYDGFSDADLVIEAVFEGMSIKKKVFGELDTICKNTAILASNTSSLNIDEIARATSRPQSVIGTHFFSPANVMRLLEIVRGKLTSKEVIATCMQLSKKLGKVGVLVGNCRGFVGNRMFHPYRREAQFMVEEGAPVEVVDQALYDFGMAMGPLATGDLAGLDVGWRIRKEYRHLEKPGVRQPIAEDQLCEMGRFGQKTQAGWYRYDETRRPLPDPQVGALVRKWAEEGGIEQRQISTDEIVDRCILALVNEGARILEEGIALRAVDIDIIYINGYGFPAYRGGPMWYADTLGLDKVYRRILQFQEQHGELWQPAPLLTQLAKEKRKFADFAQGQPVTA